VPRHFSEPRECRGAFARHFFASRECRGGVPRHIIAAGNLSFFADDTSEKVRDRRIAPATRCFIAPGSVALQSERVVADAGHGGAAAESSATSNESGGAAVA
jgi:hypothetical protein